MHKILIVYASQFGTTREVAQAIGEALRSDTTIVETAWAGTIKDPSAYSAVIIGSPIQYDKWMLEASNFVKTHQKTLATMPVAFFFTCLALSQKTEKSKRQALRYSDALATRFSQVAPVSIGRFAGVLDYSKLPFLARPLARILFAFLRVKEGDYRDWRAIHTWAKNIGPDLQIQNERESK